MDSDFYKIAKCEGFVLKEKGKKFIADVIELIRKNDMRQDESAELIECLEAVLINGRNNTILPAGELII